MSCANSILHLIPRYRVCEIGIRRADSTIDFLKRGCFVYMIDPWEDYPEYDEKNYDYETDYQITLSKIGPWDGQYKIFKEKSSDCVNEIPGDLDLVYIDGNHQYEFVKEDIVNYWPKIKKGGWLTGDDYVLHMPGVYDAVNEFIRENPDLKLETFHHNWAIKKI